MAYDEKLVERMRRLLAGRRDVVEKKMMGSIAFMVNGAMCGAVGPTVDSALFRVSPDGYDAVLHQRHVTPMVMRGRTMSGFVRVAVAGLRSDEALAEWVERGIAAGAAKRKAAPKKPAKRRG